MRNVDELLAEWQQHQVVSAAQADKIRSYEATRAPSAGEAGDAAEGGVPTWLEVVGYIGAILVVSGVCYLLFESWSALGTEGKIATASVLLLITAGLGVAAHPMPSRAAQRLASLLLFIAVHLVAWLTFIVADDAIDVRNWEDRYLAVAISAGAAALGVYLLRRTALTVILLIYAAAALVDAILEKVAPDLQFEWIALSVAAVCLAAVAAAVLGWIEPRRPALIFAGLWSVLWIDVATWWGGSRVVLLPLALAIATAYLVLAVLRRGDGALMVPGGLGVLVVLPQLIHHMFGESLLTWFAVIVIGVGLLVLVVWRARRKPGDAAAVEAIRRDEI